MQRFLLAFGRTSLLMHVIQIIWRTASGYYSVCWQEGTGGVVLLRLSVTLAGSTVGQGYNLPVVYATWLAVVLMLYPIFGVVRACGSASGGIGGSAISSGRVRDFAEPASGSSH